MKSTLKILVAGALLCALGAPSRAQDSPGQVKIEAPAIKAGELRLDGKINGLLNVGQWQMEAISWTSPRDVTTDFAEPKSKTIVIAPDAYIHPLNETNKVALKDVKLGTRIAVIGTNAPDGSLRAREVILLEGYGSRKTVGTVSTNPFTLNLVRQSRKAREEGNLPRAMTLIDSAITAAQGINDASGEGLATQDKTLLYFDMDELDKAAQSAARVEALGRSANNPLLITMGMNGQGSALARAGQYDKAIQILEAADPIGAGSEPAIHLSTLGALATVYGRADRDKDAIATLQRIFPLEESLRQSDDATETLLSLAVALAPTDQTKAREYLTQAAPRIDQAADEKVRANLRAASGTAKWVLGDKDAARTDFETSAKLYEGAGEPKRAAAVRELPTQLEQGQKATNAATPAPDDANNPNMADEQNGDNADNGGVDNGDNGDADNGDAVIGDDGN